MTGQQVPEVGEQLGAKHAEKDSTQIPLGWLLFLLLSPAGTDGNLKLRGSGDKLCAMLLVSTPALTDSPQQTLD